MKIAAGVKLVTRGRRERIKVKCCVKAPSLSRCVSVSLFFLFSVLSNRLFVTAAVGLVSQRFEPALSMFICNFYSLFLLLPVQKLSQD